MNDQPAVLDPAVARDLSTEIARLALAQEWPDELMVFDEAAEEYFADPATALHGQSRDEAVGFGAELAILTPIALALAQFVLGFVVDVVKETAKDRAKPLLAAFAARLLKRDKPAKDAASLAPVLSTAQTRRVQEAAVSQAERLGLPAETASRLGMAIVVALATGE